MEQQKSFTLEKTESTPEKSKADQKTVFVREVSALYRGVRRATTQISKPKDAGDFIRKLLPDNSREHFVALYLDGAHKIIAYSLVSTGTANLCMAHPREVFQNAILAGAVSVLVGHNHPSGETKPSKEDVSLTTRLKEVGELLGIKLLDHVIIGEDAIHSFLETDGL